MSTLSSGPAGPTQAQQRGEQQEDNDLGGPLGSEQYRCVSESDPFLAAITADPDDDAPRLIYADYLELERGDSERAAFIRLQCALARMPEEDEGRPGLKQIERDLLDHGCFKHELADEALQARCGRLSSPTYTFRPGFHRGFPAPLLERGGALVPPVPALIEDLTDQDAGVRRMAAVALSRIGPGAIEAVPALITALCDQDVTLRYAAAWALGRVGPGAIEAVPALITALCDQRADVRHEAARALSRIGPATGRTAEESR